MSGSGAEAGGASGEVAFGSFAERSSNRDSSAIARLVTTINMVKKRRLKRGCGVAKAPVLCAATDFIG
jgi:hypothetical protein